MSDLQDPKTPFSNRPTPISRSTLTRLIHLIPSSTLPQSSQDSWELTKLEKKLLRVKEANVESLKALKIKIRNETKNELKNTVLDLQSQFQLDVETIKSDFDKLKAELSHKAHKFIQYGLHNIDQFYFSCNFQLEEKPFFTIKRENFEKQLKKLREEIDVLRIQLDSIKEVNAGYSKEVQIELMKVTDVDNEIKKINMANQAAMQMLKQELGSKKDEIFMEREKIQTDFEGFCGKIAQEIEIRKVLEQRQMVFIERLKQEIKDSKVILQNPRMRIRVRQKLRELSETRTKGEGMEDSPNRSGNLSAKHSFLSVKSKPT